MNLKDTAQAIARYNRKLMNLNPIPPFVMLGLLVVIAFLYYCKSRHWI